MIQNWWRRGTIGGVKAHYISIKAFSGTDYGSLQQDDVLKALDHAKIAQGSGGPAEMVPGQHHVRMNMYIAQAHNDSFRIVENLGRIDPKECMQGIR